MGSGLRVAPYFPSESDYSFVTPIGREADKHYIGGRVAKEGCGLENCRWPVARHC